MYKLCLSDAIKVKLTDEGKKVLDDYLKHGQEKLSKDVIPTPMADENDMYSFDMKFFIKLYGDKLVNSKNCIENFEIFIDEHTLEVV